MSHVLKIKYENNEYTAENETSLVDFLKQNSLKFPLVVKIDSKLYDLSHTLKTSCTIQPVFFDDDEGKHVFWHSSAHILGYAIKNIFNDALLTSGPPTSNGFYYDVKLSRSITQEDYKLIAEEANKIIKANYKFVRSIKTKEELLDFYKDNKYKTHYVNKIETTTSTMYTCGGFHDFCGGPHIYSTGLLKTFEVVNHGSSYFLGKNTEDSLQRIYAISFPSKDLHKQYKTRLELAKQRDHRRLGTEHELFFFNELSPGSCFFLPNGAYIYNTLIAFLRDEYAKRGFKEVVTPNMFSTRLWEQSGHLMNYKENMFCFDVDETEFALKPMNCPGHCVMFKHTNRSYKQLPLRLADFGVLHRNELSGTLTGLTRVRRFQQDDAHIFCAKEQIEAEILSCLDFLDYVYTKFNFTYEIFLSTRPDKYIGKVEDWDEAESKLKSALRNKKYRINAGDGAFYGPKIDIVLEDALGRKNQCATIQLDFQLPDRFDLTFTNKLGALERPVMIHRAILGSVERFIAILIESFGIKLPFWISPFQLAIIGVSEEQEKYCVELKNELHMFNCVVINDQGMTLNKKIRYSEVSGYKLIAVIGPKEVANGTVNLRGKGEYTKEDLKNKLIQMKSRMIEFEALN